ncbi:DDE endonuclease [Protofrankia sp. BMG5.30]|uniref:DDE endonuclease n=2 Tax=Frankiaceae TaxID=74712 RepID=A0ABR5F1L0_9ACTN|nr:MULTISPECIES: IS701 family transposase [Protofrankia]KLL10590.1 DDE endonuclease [Protofrankia coriariae]ONH34164.1 DDE endonuclease [Protofrankia sp. BMG5.30]
MEQVRPVVEEFAARMLADLPRKDQRAKGELYLRGLMLDGKRKSLVPMAARLGVDHQGLQQFLRNSTWEHGEVRRRLAGWAVEFVAPEALVVDDTGFPKDGPASPGVARMYSGTLGKVGNCQIGVSVHAVTDWASAALDWRLFLPASWDDTACDPAEAAAVRDRRTRAGIPTEVRHREKWRLALDMFDELAGWGVPPRPVVADAGYGDAAEFRQALTDRRLVYVLGVTPTATAHPADAVPVTAPYSGNGRRPVPAYPDPPSTLKALALAAGRSALRTVTWRHGTHRSPANPDAAMRSRFMALRIRPTAKALTRADDRSLPECWLLAEWPPGKAEPTDYWLSTLPADIPLRQLVRLAKIRWRIEHDYRELKDGLGLDHHEGRSFLGWHRHVTLVCVAQALCTQLRRSPKAPAPA